jgi:5'-3' exonuclease
MLIYDVNNWVRVKMAESLGGASIVSLYNEVMANSLAGKVQVFVSDGVNSRKKRKEIYPGYKAKRKPADQSIYDGINLFKEMLVNMPQNVLRVEIPEWEADDVIANLVEKTFVGMPIDIVSTDRDLNQLCIHENVKTLKEPLVDARLVKLNKVLVGDSSDNIPGVSGFGPGAWDKLSDDFKKRMVVGLYQGKGKIEDEVLVRMLDKEPLLGKSLKEKIALENRVGLLQQWYRLVSFMNIPDDLLKLESGTGKTYLNDEKIEQLGLGL